MLVAYGAFIKAQHHTASDGESYAWNRYLSAIESDRPVRWGDSLKNLGNLHSLKCREVDVAIG